MPKKWNELTETGIDALEGAALSWAVGEAMGYTLLKKDGVILYEEEREWWEPWKPHSDANQALEVWAAMPGQFDYHVVMRPAENIFGFSEVTVYRDDRAQFNQVASGDFCTAICRAFIKVRLVEANNITVLDVKVGDPMMRPVGRKEIRG